MDLLVELSDDVGQVDGGGQDPETEDCLRGRPPRLDYRHQQGGLQNGREAGQDDEQGPETGAGLP